MVTNMLLQDSTDDASVQGRWQQWITLSAKHRLLVSCYLLEARHHPMLAEDMKSPSSRVLVDDLHFPSHETLWEAQDPRQWWTHVQEYSMMPRCIAEATVCRMAGSYDAFQSSVLIAALYPPSSFATPHLQLAVEHLLHDGPATRQQLAIAKLVQVAPIRALLAVSGESWILGTKVTSQEEFAAYKTELHFWVAHLWSATVGDHSQSITEALRLSVEILTSSLNAQEPRNLSFNDLGLFFAALMLWAATATASSRLHASGYLSQQAHSLLPAATTNAPRGSSGHPKRHTVSSSPRRPTQSQQNVLSVSDRRPSIPYTKITANTLCFLSTAVEDVTSFNVSACQTGCRFMLLWVKMQLRGSHSSGHDTILSDHHVAGHNPGELVNEAIGQIERMLDYEWVNWGI